jgi:hypothetical protein
VPEGSCAERVLGDANRQLARWNRVAAWHEGEGRLRAHAHFDYCVRHSPASMHGDKQGVWLRYEIGQVADRVAMARAEFRV